MTEKGGDVSRIPGDLAALDDWFPSGVITTIQTIYWLKNMISRIHLSLTGFVDEFVDEFVDDTKMIGVILY